MEKVIECGVRIKEADVMLSDVQFEKVLLTCCDRVSALVSAQRFSYLSVSAASSTKSVQGFTPYKGFELYCRIKGEPQLFMPDDKGIECGIRIKEFALELPDEAFKVYLGGCIDVFRESALQQRAAYQIAQSTKSLDLDTYAKAVEFYCEAKSMCA
jgi:hypothetical protein